MPAAHGGASNPAAGVRKPPKEETAMGERVELPRALTYPDLTAAAVISQHNFTVMARTLRMVENDFNLSCNFNELGVAKRAHISTSALCA
jgi:hypothetical protein